MSLKLILKIEDSKLILNQDEINIQIDKYNNELSKFSNLVDEFNSHYQYQIFKIREMILEEIIVLLEKYASENNVDLILDSTSYLIASNSLDITEIIKKNLNKLNLKLEFDNFEKIKYLDIKNILKQNSIDVNSDLSDDETLLSVKTLINSTQNDLTFFSNLKYLDDLSNIKAKACLIKKIY